jgi:hypothetical protein
MSTLSTVLLCIGAMLVPVTSFWLGYERGSAVATAKLQGYWQHMEQVAIYWAQRSIHLRAKLDALEQKRHDEGEGWKKG